MKFRKTMGTLTMVATAALASMATATPAAAVDWDHTWTSSDANPGATIKVREYGDLIRLCDTDADGYSAYAEISYSGTSFTLRASGNGNCNTSNAQEHNIPENINVDVLVGLWHSDKPGIHFPGWGSFTNDQK